MTDMDVSLRLRLVNQLSRPAEEAERDLKDLKKAAEQLGRTKGGDGLAQGLADVGRKAEAAKAGIKGIEEKADQLRQAIGRTGSGFDTFKADAAKAEASIAGIKDKADNARLAISRIGEGFGNLKADAMNVEGGLQGIQQQAAATKAAIGRMGDGAFQTLTGDAAKAEAAIRQIGTAADAAEGKLRGLRTGGVVPGARGQTGLPRTGGGMMSTVEGAVDQFGVPLAIGAGGAYLAGAVPAGIVVAGGAAVSAAAGDEFTSDNLRVLGEYSGEDQARYDRIMAGIGARKGVGTGGAMSVFGKLMAGGLDAEGAAATTEAAIMFGKATQASPEDAARTTIALRNTFGIGTDDIMGAYDAMAMGGKAGEFEVPDMAKNFPSIASKMAALGEGGLSGTRLLVALGQSIRKTAGTSDEASTNFENMLGKFRSPDFIKNAKGYGINVPKTLTEAEKAGGSPVMALLEEIQKKVGNDGFKLAKLMPDVQSLAGLEASLNGLQDVKKLMDDMESAPGTVMNDFTTATDNASSAFDRFTANIAAKAKFLAAYALPPLTAAMNGLSDAMEGDSEPQQIIAPENASGDVKAQIHAANDRGARMNRFFENLFGFEKSDTSRRLDTVDAYRQYGLTRMEGERGGPSVWKRFMLGDAAYDALPSRARTGTGGGGGWGDESEKGFSFRDHVRQTLGRGPKKIDPAISGDVPSALGSNFGGAAEKAMGSYNEALAAEGEKAKVEAQSIADYIKSILGFTVSPTIKPTFVSPDGGGSGSVPAGGGTGQQSSVQNSSSNFKLTQNISSPNSRVAAIRSQREANRSVRMAQSRALGDIGPRTA